MDTDLHQRQAQPSQPSQRTTMDRIIDDALAKARDEAIASVFDRFGNDSEIDKLIRAQVVEYLKSEAGHAKIIELADKSIEALKRVERRNW